jgi:homospermidine synthase
MQKLARPPGRIVILGYGSVGQAILELILQRYEIDPRNITVLDAIAHPIFKARHENSGIRYIVQRIDKTNMERILVQLLSPGDFLVNVSLNIDGIAIVRFCLENGIQYIDTSIERWPDEPDELIPDLSQRTLYSTHQEIRQACKDFVGRGPTCVVTHGANPGLVTHFTKQAVLNIATAMGIQFNPPQSREEWAQLMKATGTKVIHIAERDTQISKYPKRTNEFCNSWSCEGLFAEGRAPSELGWGTHEDPNGPQGGSLHDYGPGNGAYLYQPGVATLVKSWVPNGGKYNGFLIQHSEAITLSEYFTTEDQSFRPTVHYAYQPCDAAILSIHEMRNEQLRFHKRTRILKNSIVSGEDELGVLLMGHGLTSYWYGSQLDIDTARSRVPGESATSVQVACSLIAAMTWAMENPDRGYVEPEQIPHDYIMRIATPYLGNVVGIQSDWNPLVDRSSLYGRKWDESNIWSFENFRVY